MNKLSSASKLFRNKKKKRDINHGMLVAVDTEYIGGDDSSSLSSPSSSAGDAQQNTENQFRWSVTLERSTGTDPMYSLAEKDGKSDDDDLYTNGSCSTDGTSKKTKKNNDVESSKSKAAIIISKGNSSKKDEKRTKSRKHENKPFPVGTEYEVKASEKTNEKLKKSKSRRHENKPFRVETEYEIEESEKTNEELKKVKHKHKKRKGKGKRKPSKKSIDENLVGDLPDAGARGSSGSSLASPSYLKNSIGSKIRMSLAQTDKFGHSLASSKPSLSFSRQVSIVSGNGGAAVPQTLSSDPPLNISNGSQTGDTSTNVNTVYGRKPKEKSVRKISVFATMLGRLSSEREFLAAYNNEDSDEEEGKNNLKQNNDKKRQKQRQKDVDKMLKEFEKEQIDITNERDAIQLERASFEQLLNAEMSKNVYLESQIEALEEEVSNVSGPHQVPQLKEENNILRTENEVLKQRHARDEERISSLHGRKGSWEENHSHLYSSDRPSIARISSLHGQKGFWKNNHSHLHSSDRPSIARSVMEVRPSNRHTSERLLDDIVHELPNDDSDDSDDDSDSDSDDSALQTMGVRGGAQGDAKVQGELLQLRSSLTHKTLVLEEQAKVISDLMEAQGDAKVQGELLQLRSSLTHKTLALEEQAKVIGNLMDAQGNAKLQGELLQLRSSLTHKTLALEEQAKVIGNLMEELEVYTRSEVRDFVELEDAYSGVEVL